MSLDTFRLNLCLGEGLNVAVGIYATHVAARIPGAVKLYRETNKAIRSKTRTFHTQTGSLLLPSETKKAQVSTNRVYISTNEIYSTNHCAEHTMMS